MSKEMYPLVDEATYVTKFDNFDEVRDAVERTDEGLNLIESWFVHVDDREDRDEFGLVLFMPRKGQTAQFETSVFDAAKVQDWLDGYVKDRVLRWYGWSG